MSSVHIKYFLDPEPQGGSENKDAIISGLHPAISPGERESQDWIKTGSSESISNDENFLYGNIIFLTIILCVLLALIIFCLAVTNWFHEVFGRPGEAAVHKKNRRKRRRVIRALKQTKVENWTIGDGQFPNNDSCVICLEDFSVGVLVRKLNCEHVFHVACVDNWILRMKAACPICKQRLVQPHTLNAVRSVETESASDENMEEIQTVGSRRGGETLILLTDPFHPITSQQIDVRAPRDVLLEYFISTANPEQTEGRIEIIPTSTTVQLAPVPVHRENSTVL